MRNFRVILGSSFASLVFLCGCVPHEPDLPPPTQLQVREVQTRTFETANTKMVMKAMINVLQDDGYIVKNAVLDLGLLSAEKDVDIERRGEAACLTFMMGSEARWNKHVVLEASANISEFGEKTKVRINFQRKVFDNWGAVVHIEQIADPQYYQAFFNKVNKGIFIQSEDI